MVLTFACVFLNFIVISKYPIIIPEIFQVFTVFGVWQRFSEFDSNVARSVGTHSATSCSNKARRQITPCVEVRRLCSNTLRRHVATTNRFVCTGEFLRKSFSLQQSFVAATSRTNSVWFDFLRLVVVTKLCCGDKDFHKNCPAHTKRFAAATCRCNVLLQLVAKCVPTLKRLLCRLMYCSSNTKKYASKPLLGNRLF